jgi:hypothetical protein
VIFPGESEELPVTAADLYPIQKPGQPPGPGRVTAGEYVRGKISRTAVQVIIPALLIKGEVMGGLGTRGFFP